MNLHERLARLIDRAISRGWPIEKLRWLMQLAINRDLEETARRASRPADLYVTAKVSEARRVVVITFCCGLAIGLLCLLL